MKIKNCVPQQNCQNGRQAGKQTSRPHAKTAKMAPGPWAPVLAMGAEQEEGHKFSQLCCPLPPLGQATKCAPTSGRKNMNLLHLRMRQPTTVKNRWFTEMCSQKDLFPLHFHKPDWNRICAHCTPQSRPPHKPCQCRTTQAQAPHRHQKPIKNLHGFSRSPKGPF